MSVENVASIKLRKDFTKEPAKRGVSLMLRLKDQYRNIDIAERSILARMILHPVERCILSMILKHDDLASTLHRELYSELMAMPANEVENVALWLNEMLLRRSHEKVAEIIVDLSAAPHPASFHEAVLLAMHLHCQACERENVSLREKAIIEWATEHSGCEIPIQTGDDNVEW